MYSHEKILPLIVFFSFVQTLFRAVVEPVVQPQQQTTAGQDIQNEGTSNRTEKEDGFKIVFKDAHPVST